MQSAALTKKGQEAFRVEKFAPSYHTHGEHEGISQGEEANSQGEEEDERKDADVLEGEDCPPDCSRVILHLDADCFYAQVEELRDTSLREKPLGITQKYLVVTCNYPARNAGVTKLMNIEEAKKKCPELVLVPGEDLTPYRRASESVSRVLRELGSPTQKVGMDEVFLDVTSLCKDMLRNFRAAAKKEEIGAFHLKWCGHVHRSRHTVRSESRHRPMDLRADTCMGENGNAPIKLLEAECDSDLLLMAGSMLAADARAAVREKTGVRMSAGIAHNRLLAKLASGLHKPDDQTSLPSSEASGFIRPLPVQVLRGAGYKTCCDLKSIGIETVAHLRAASKQRLMALLGDRVGAQLYEASRGRDRSVVLSLLALLVQKYTC